jgi:hypothetical protein
VLCAVQNLATTSKAALAWLVANHKESLFRAHFGEASDRGLRCATVLVKIAQVSAGTLGNVAGIAATACKVLERDAGTPSSPQLDQVVRLLGVLFLKASAVDALVREEESPAKKGAPIATLGALLRALMAVVKAVKPKEYGSSSELSLLRGNLALIFANVAGRQEDAGAHRIVSAVDLAPVVEVFIQCLRKETGPVQKNCGIAVTALARVERYKPMVRALKGFESLHQIQLANQIKTDTSIPAAFRH